MKTEKITNFILKLVIIVVLVCVAVRVCVCLDAKEADLRANTQYTEQVIKSYK